mmetsp:Transcript_23687/g.41962  ORF Transcript_23687/g.41962 Transcript_23687/m.41962 type:complete len:154 (-) Transcript_23687:1441-1902(-)
MYVDNSSSYLARLHATCMLCAMCMHISIAAAYIFWELEFGMIVEPPELAVLLAYEINWVPELYNTPRIEHRDLVKPMDVLQSVANHDDSCVELQHSVVNLMVSLKVNTRGSFIAQQHPYAMRRQQRASQRYQLPLPCAKVRSPILNFKFELSV